MEWRDLTLLVIGWGLGQLGNYWNSRQSFANALVLARDARRYETGKEAFSAAMSAVDLGLDIAGQHREPTPDEMHEILVQFYTPLRDARIAFGLPITNDVDLELIEAIFIVPTTVERGGDIAVAKTTAIAILHKHRDEITDAWKQVLHGK